MCTILSYAETEREGDACKQTNVPVQEHYQKHIDVSGNQRTFLYSCSYFLVSIIVIVIRKTIVKTFLAP